MPGDYESKTLINSYGRARNESTVRGAQKTSKLVTRTVPTLLSIRTPV